MIALAGAAGLAASASPVAVVAATYEASEPEAVRLLQPYPPDGSAPDREELYRRAQRHFGMKPITWRERVVERALEIAGEAPRFVPPPASDEVPTPSPTPLPVGGAAEVAPPPAATHQPERVGDAPVPPSPPTVRMLVAEFTHEHPDGTGQECLQFIADETGFTLSPLTFYEDYWRPRKEAARLAALTAAADGSEEDNPPPAYRRPDDFRLRDSRLRPPALLSPNMRASIRGYVLMLREDDAAIPCREAMRKAGEHFGVDFKDVHSFRQMYFAAKSQGQRVGKGSGGFRALNGRSPEEVMVFVLEVLGKSPAASIAEVLTATNLALGTRVKCLTAFGERYVRPARKQLGIRFEEAARAAMRPRHPAPPEGWRNPGALTSDERAEVVEWIREQLSDPEAVVFKIDLFRAARDRFKVDWRRVSAWTTAYLKRATNEHRSKPSTSTTSFVRTDAGKRDLIRAYVRRAIIRQPELGYCRLMRLVNEEFGTRFVNIDSFGLRYVKPARASLPAGAATTLDTEDEAMIAMAPTTNRINGVNAPFAQRSSTYTPEQKALATEWLVQYITADPTCRIDTARVDTEQAFGITIASGTFHGTFFTPALERCTAEVQAMRGRGAPYGKKAPGGKVRTTDGQRARVRQLVACLKRDEPEAVRDLAGLIARAEALDGVRFHDASSFRQHYVDKVEAAAPGVPYPQPKGAASAAPPAPTAAPAPAEQQAPATKIALPPLPARLGGAAAPTQAPVAEAAQHEAPAPAQAPTAPPAQPAQPSAAAPQVPTDARSRYLDILLRTAERQAEQNAVDPEILNRVERLLEVAQ